MNLNTWFTKLYVFHARNELYAGYEIFVGDNFKILATVLSILVTNIQHFYFAVGHQNPKIVTKINLTVLDDSILDQLLGQEDAIRDCLAFINFGVVLKVQNLSGPGSTRLMRLTEPHYQDRSALVKDPWFFYRSNSSKFDYRFIRCLWTWQDDLVDKTYLRFTARNSENIFHS